MIQKLMLWAWALALLVSPASAAQNGAKTAEAGAGEGRPLPCTWEAFSSAMAEEMEEIRFSEAYWSDGRWVHLADNYVLVFRVYTSDETDGGEIQAVRIDTPLPENTAGVQEAAAAACRAAVRPVCQENDAFFAAAAEDHGEEWFAETPKQVWAGNGYALSFGRTESFGKPYAELLFSEPAAVSGGYLPLEKEYILLPEGKRPKELMDALKKQATEGPLSSYLSAPILPKTNETNADGRVYLVEWDDCLLILLTDPTGDDLLVVNLFSLSGNTNSMCVHLYSLYASVAGIEAEDILLIAAFVGGDGTWDDMSRLTPYCVVNEVQLQCSFADMGNGQVLPEAEICGAKGKE